MWLLSCFFTSGWTHSCSREPSTHTLGLTEDRAMGSKNERAPSPSAVQQQEHVLWGHRGRQASPCTQGARGSGWGRKRPQAWGAPSLLHRPE